LAAGLLAADQQHFLQFFINASNQIPDVSRFCTVMSLLLFNCFPPQTQAKRRKAINLGDIYEDDICLNNNISNRKYAVPITFSLGNTQLKTLGRVQEKKNGGTNHKK